MNIDFKNFNLPKLEEKILKFWGENSIFQKSLSKKSPRQKTFVFYEGPPTANGRPGIHHVLSRSFKDVILRYKTMRGYLVPRKGGWDTHGLPVELEVEKRLGLKSKKEVEQFGIEKFNEECRKSVWEYKEEWERLTERIGFWLDLDNPYITYETNYIETLWWIIKRVWDQGLLYRGHKIINWCTRCGTSLSSHEVAQGYDTVSEDSIYVKLKVKKGQKIGNFKVGDNTYILAWTTTPWTLPGNVALAVGEKINYALIKKDGEVLILAEDRIKGLKLSGDTVGKVRGRDLIGLSYEPLFNIKSLINEKSYKIYSADFVTTDDGTGVVHTAVMYGEDDYNLGAKIGLPAHHTVDERGKFKKEVLGFGGLYVKDKKTDGKIFDYLKNKNRLFMIQNYSHEYPFCWRCGTPLLYYARESWFIAMSKLRNKLLLANKEISWLPAHIKNGRFGEWLKEVKDWNFSRERYWGTPLPIWQCSGCENFDVIGSISDLDKKTGGTRNRYWLLRHGEAESQLLNITDSGRGKYHLTPKGQEQVRRSAKKLMRENFDFIVSSDVLRTKETSKIASDILGIKDIIYDQRLREVDFGIFTGKPNKEYHQALPSYGEKFKDRPEKGESLRDVRTRVWGCLNDLEKKYKGKKILLISHEYPIWMTTQSAEGWDEKRAIAEKIKRGRDFIDLAGTRELNFLVTPRNRTGEVDLHRPFVDDVVINCSKCGSKSRRIREVADVWFDSGAMPFAQEHFPFDFGDVFKSKKAPRGLSFPADYITEAVDQTRGWFYTLLATSVLLGYGPPYKNVVSLGLVRDKYGRKMSKSKGNIVNPWEMADKYGIDAVRWYFFYSAPPGEPRNFDENEILKVFRKFHLTFWNSLIFFRTYGDKKIKNSNIKPRHILDRWMIARFNETEKLVENLLDSYEIRGAAIALMELVDDLSNWYIRRSRRRFSINNRSYQTLIDRQTASETLGEVIFGITKMIAPFVPFLADAVYAGVKEYKSKGRKSDSIHLEAWPTAISISGNKNLSQLIREMAEIRRLASVALAKRSESGIKVRQPLRELKIKSKLVFQSKNKKDLLILLAEEINVKKVVIDLKIKEDILLDIELTPKLKEEGMVREFLRTVQGLRQKSGLAPKDKIILMVKSEKELGHILENNVSLIKQEVGASKLVFNRIGRPSSDIDTKIEGMGIWLGIRKM